jgi:hypothetical protein
MVKPLGERDLAQKLMFATAALAKVAEGRDRDGETLARSRRQIVEARKLLAKPVLRSKLEPPKTG